uniref:Uncharacterized protein n=1 Tax=Setaria viridis TaxID=4556 RepID=A0A4V6D6D7_SETVI|nr:hypothetical protein SEVIR_5G137250v2 [Setaria viridis]
MPLPATASARLHLHASAWLWAGGRQVYTYIGPRERGPSRGYSRREMKRNGWIGLD